QSAEVVRNQLILSVPIPRLATVQQIINTHRISYVIECLVVRFDQRQLFYWLYLDLHGNAAD
ncbi:MAG: hypothetical protein ACK52S_18940, partial [Pirellula sp.]